MQTNYTTQQFATACPSEVMTLAGEFVEQNYELPEGSVIDTRSREGEVWADTGGPMYLLAYLSELLENETFDDFILNSSDFEMFATKGDGF